MPAMAMDTSPSSMCVRRALIWTSAVLWRQLYTEGVEKALSYSGMKLNPGSPVAVRTVRRVTSRPTHRTSHWLRSTL
ncbi:hypothetical protein BC567DRAFT_223457 [Phyllosticta citribraziliensis]